MMKESDNRKWQQCSRFVGKRANDDECAVDEVLATKGRPRERGTPNMLSKQLL